MSRKTVFGIFHCNTPEDLSNEFTDFRIKQQLKAGGNPVPGTLAAAEGIEIKTIRTKPWTPLSNLAPQDTAH